MCRKQCPPRHATEREYRIAERRSPLFLHEFAVQRGRRGGKYLNFGKLTYMCVFTIENNHLVLLRASEQLFATALARALYQYVENFSNTFLVVFQRKSVLQSNEFVKATNLDILGNVIIEMFCCISAGKCRLTIRIRALCGVWHPHATNTIRGYIFCSSASKSCRYRFAPADVCVCKR